MILNTQMFNDVKYNTKTCSFADGYTIKNKTCFNDNSLSYRLAYPNFIYVTCNLSKIKPSKDVSEGGIH